MAQTKTKIDIFSGFLGAGKTTLIKKLIQEAFGGEKLVLIENEFGEIGIDGGPPFRPAPARQPVLNAQGCHAAVRRGIGGRGSKKRCAGRAGPAAGRLSICWSN